MANLYVEEGLEKDWAGAFLWVAVVLVIFPLTAIFATVGLPLLLWFFLPWPDRLWAVLATSPMWAIIGPALLLEQAEKLFGKSEVH